MNVRRLGVWFLLPVLMCWVFEIRAQVNMDSLLHENHVVRLMERTDLTLREIEERAQIYFNRVGTGKGTGFKQFQRWLFERKFHLNSKGFYIDQNTEASHYETYMAAKSTASRNTSPWTEMGPMDWENTSGWNPGIGRITTVAIHPANESIIYVGSPGGGIWKSTNGGSSWNPLLDDLNAAWMYIYHLHIDPLNQNTLYAAVMYSGGGVIKSTNAGATWTATGSGPSNTRKVVVHPSNSNIIFATAVNGVWRSVNAGTSWTQVHSDNSEDLEFKPGDPNIVYVSGTSNTLKRSSDNGLSWATIGDPEGITHFGRTLLAVSPNNPNVVYAVQSDADIRIFGRLYKSTNSGLNFSTTVIGDPVAGTNFFGYDNAGLDNVGQAWHDMAICANPANANEVHIAGIICWKSIDGGFNFTSETAWYYPNDYGYNHADVHALEWVNSTIYSGSDGGIFKSTNNGGDWIDLSVGLGIRQIYRLSNAKTDPNVITIGSQDNGSSYRQSTGQWLEWLGADGMDNMISPVNASVAYGMWQLGGLNKTLDGGQTRIYLGQPSEGNWITPMAMHPTDHNHIYAGWTGVYKSTDGGNNWDHISDGFINQRLNTLAVAPSNINFLYASVNNKLFRTSNGGMSWDSLTMSHEVTSIFISATDPQKIWVTLSGTSNQVLYSSNMGTNFSAISTGLPSLAARTIVVDEADDNGVYVGMNIGVYYRNDVDPDWVPFGTSLPLVAINELAIHASSGKIRVGTYGRGVWENGLINGPDEECTEFAYVPNHGDDDVSVVNLSTQIEIATIPVGSDPWGVCHTSTGDKVYITNRGSHSVSVISTTNPSVIATIQLTSGTMPEGIAILPDDSKLYTANRGNSTVSVIHPTTFEIIDYLDVFEQPIFVQPTPNGSHIYVTYATLPFIRTINTTTHQALNIPLPTKGGDIKFIPDGSKAFVSNVTNSIYVVNTGTNTVDHTIHFPGPFYAPNAMWISPDGEKLYVALLNQGTVAIINTSTYAIEQYITGISQYPEGISSNHDGSLLYVTNSFLNKVFIINTTSNTVVGDFNVGNSPAGFGDFVVGCTDTEGPAICGTTIYDSGGPDGNYSHDEDDIQVLCPENNEEKVVLDFLSFELEAGYDYLKIFDGASISAPPLHPGIGFSGTQSPGTLLSSDLSGCLTLHFTSDGSVAYSGWVADVECVSTVCGSMVYDSGGPNMPYADNEDQIDILCPVLNEDKIELVFLEFELETGYDYLRIFDGNSISDPPLHSGNGFTGSTLPGPFISSNDNGCITLHFTSDGSIVEEGWVAEVSCTPRICETLLTDSGGANGNYSNGEDQTEVLCPDQPGDILELTFLVFSLENNYDYLRIYDGNSINSPPLHSGNGFTGMTLPGTFISTHSSGCLTTHFLSDLSVTSTGWEATMVCIPQSTCNTIFWDSGGATENYANHEDIITTLCPETDEMAISIEFTSFQTEAQYDALYIFNGDQISDPQFMSGNPATQSGYPAGGYYGNTLPGTFVSTHPSGCLTIRFRSDFSITFPGWAAHVDCIAPCTSHVTSLIDGGPGSLREAIGCDGASETITFDEDVHDQFFDLVNGSIEITRNIVLAPPANQFIRIRALEDSPIFVILNGSDLRIENVDLYGGQNQSGNAIVNFGNLILRNIRLFNPYGVPGSRIDNFGTVFLEGTIELKN